MHKQHFFKFFDTLRLPKQRGAALAETLVALLPILLLGSVCFELARGYQVRHLLVLSLQEAARVAAVHHAAPQAWQPALRDALSTLFAPAGHHASPQTRRDAACETFKQAFRMPCWHAVALTSTPETIHLRLTYLHRPMQEWLRVLLQKMAHLHARLEQTEGRQRPLERQAWQLGLIPMVVEYRVLRHRSTGVPE
jgi:hypothetical protein